MASRAGRPDSTIVRGSMPAQDGTVVSMVAIYRSGRPSPDILRLIWRGDRLVSAGDGAGLRRPTALFSPVAGGTMARFEPSTGATTTLHHDAEGSLRIAGPSGTLVLTADHVASIAPPPVPAVRALLHDFLERGAEAGLARIDALARARPGAYDFSESALNDLGYVLLAAERHPLAIAVFRKVTEDHPASANAHDSLGEALLAAGDSVGARLSYQRSLDLNPDNENARRIVERLGQGIKP
jgi:tetratricopeptide (TPR) repeat protein